MKKILSFLIALIIFSCTVFSLPTPISAAGELKVSNQDGVIYVTTENEDGSFNASDSSTTTRYYNDVLRGRINPGTGFATNIVSIINFTLRIVFVVAILMVLVMLIWGGLAWITSGGDKGKTEAARNRLVAAVVGLLIIAASYAILTLIIHYLGFSDIHEVINSVPPITQSTKTSTSSSQLRDQSLVQ